MFKKQKPAVVLKYKQTNIISYFKVINKYKDLVDKKNGKLCLKETKTSNKHVMSLQRKHSPCPPSVGNQQIKINPTKTSDIHKSSAMSDNVEDNVELDLYDEIVRKCRKKPKPISSSESSDSSDSENDSRTISKSKTESKKTKIRQTRKYLNKRNRKRSPLLSNCEDVVSDCDSEFNIAFDLPHYQDIKVSKPSNDKTMRKYIKSLPEKNKLEQQVIVVNSSSSDEEFIPISPKNRKIEKLLSTLKNETETPKTCDVKQKLFKSELDQKKSPSSIVEKSRNANLKSSFTTTDPSTSSLPTSTSPKVPICVNKPDKVSTIKERPKPRILISKTNNTSPENEEFITSESLSASIVELIRKSCSFRNSSNNQTIDNKNAKNITVLENIVVSTPEKQNANTYIKQCDISPNNVTSPAVTKKISQKAPLNKSKLEEQEEDTWNPLALQLFKKIVEYVMSHSHLKNLLVKSECLTLNRFFAMQNENYMYFCIKLFMRIQKWYNVFKLRTLLKLNMTDPEVKDMYHCLIQNGFVDNDFSKESCVNLLNHLNLKDVRQLCDSFKIKCALKRKETCIEMLLNNCNKQTTLTTIKSTETILKERIKDKMGICVKLTPYMYEVLNKIHVLYYFTGDFQKIADLYLLMSKIEIQQIYMPEFTIHHYEIFSSTEEFSSFATAFECERSVEEAFEKKDIPNMFQLCLFAYEKLQNILTSFQVVKPPYLMRFTAGHKYARTLTKSAKHLAKHNANHIEEILLFLLDQKQFCTHLRGLWYNELVKIQYHYLKKCEKATETLIEALLSKDISEVQLYELNYRAEAMKTHTNKLSELLRNKICFVQPSILKEAPFIEIDAHAIQGNNQGAKRRYMQKKEGETRVLSVEEIALQYYLKNGFSDGFHCEGSLFETLLFLFFWDLIYECYVPGVFVNEIQYLPLDFYSAEFYINRKNDIDVRLEQIRTKWPWDHLKIFLLNIWSKHAHKRSLINDNLIEEPNQLIDIILCIGREKLFQVLERIIKNYKTYHSGLPDLFLWNVKEKTCKFVEVKGQNDKLSTKQKLWLHFLITIGADAEVCHVHTMGTRKRVSIKGNPTKKEEK